METVQVELGCSQLIGALERILVQHGYRTLRSFDLPLAGQRCAFAEDSEEHCNCRYAVLLVFTNLLENPTPESIAIQGQGDCSTVSLHSPNAESELAAHFALLLWEALRSVGDVRAI